MEKRSPSMFEQDLETRFEDLVKAHQVMLYRYARFLTRDPQLAEEIAQDTLITAYMKLRRDPPSGDLGAWLRGITRNLVLRVRSKRKVQVLFCDDETLAMAESLWSGKRMRVPKSARENPRLEALRQCIQTLEPKEAHLLKLRFEEGLARPEIAKQLQLTMEGVKTRLRRLRTKLLECTRRRLSASGGPP